MEEQRRKCKNDILLKSKKKNNSFKTKLPSMAYFNRVMVTSLFPCVKGMLLVVSIHLVAFDKFLHLCHWFFRTVDISCCNQKLLTSSFYCSKSAKLKKMSKSTRSTLKKTYTNNDIMEVLLDIRKQLRKQTKVLSEWNEKLKVDKSEVRFPRAENRTIKSAPRSGMHFWIDKRSQSCGFGGRARVAASLSGTGYGAGFGHYPRRQRPSNKPMATPIHRFQTLDSSRPHVHRNPAVSSSHLPSAAANSRSSQNQQTLSQNQQTLSQNQQNLSQNHQNLSQNQQNSSRNFVQNPQYYHSIYGGGPVHSPLVEPMDPLLIPNRTPLVQTMSNNSTEVNVESDSEVVLRPEQQLLPTHLKCGMWASLALATVFVAGAKFYFDHQGTGLEVLIFCAFSATFFLAACTISLCRRPRHSSSGLMPNSSSSNPNAHHLHSTNLDGNSVSNNSTADSLHHPHQFHNGTDISVMDPTPIIAPPPPYHIAVLLPENNKESDESPPPSYDKIVI